MSMKEFLQYLATPAALGSLVTLLMYVIQKAKPEVQDDLAFVVSVGLAACIGMGAYFLMPFVDKLPPEVGAIVWPTLVWAWNYIIFRFGPKKAAERR